MEPRDPVPLGQFGLVFCTVCGKRAVYSRGLCRGCWQRIYGKSKKTGNGREGIDPRISKDAMDWDAIVRSYEEDE